MLDPLSKIDELFRDASLKEEQKPAEGNWDDMRKKLYGSRSWKRKLLLWSAMTITAGLIALSAFIILNNHSSDLVQPKTASHPILININKETVQKDTSKKTISSGTVVKANNTSNNNYTGTTTTYTKENKQNIQEPYKIQIGAFKNKLPENYFSSFANVTEEDKDGYYKYYAGSYTNLADAVKRLDEMKKMGFSDAFIASENGPVYNHEYSTVASTATIDQKPKVNDHSTKVDLPVVQKKITTDSVPKNVIQPKDTVKIKTDTTGKNNSGNKKNNPVVKIALKKYGIGVAFSYDITKFRMTENTSDGTRLLGSSNSLLQGSNNFSYSIGAQFTYRFSDKIAVETGLSFSQKKKLSATDIVEDTVKHFSFEYNGKYLDLPLRVRYYVLNSPVKHFVSAGALFSSNFPVKNNGYFQYQNLDTSIYTEKVFIEPTSIGVSLQLGAGIDYVIQNKWRLYFSPIYNYGLSAVLKHPTYNNEPVKHFINGVCISFGCYYDF